jgi:4-hydroxy-tetrahydrodipicolinate synthase
MLRLNGITPVMATPFFADERIDEESLRRQIDFAIESGAAAVCGPGYASEFYKLSDDERRRFVEILVEQTKGRVPVIAATSCDSTSATLQLSQYAQGLGADCVMVTPPRTVAMPVSQTADYYSTLCRELKIALMLQDADFTGAGMPAAIFIDLAKRHDNFLFAKLEVALPGPKALEIMEGTQGQVQVIYGLGGIRMIDGFDRGASAVMPGAAVLEVYVRIYQLFHSGDRAAARSLFHQLLPYLSFALQHLELAITIEKTVLERRGILASARLRKPTLPLTATYGAEMEAYSAEAAALAEQCRTATLHA